MFGLKWSNIKKMQVFFLIPYVGQHLKFTIYHCNLEWLFWNCFSDLSSHSVNKSVILTYSLIRPLESGLKK